MPIYTYRCENCGVRFEQTQKFADAPLTRCPECRKNTLRKVYTPVGIVFKGSGFYSTDHHSPSGQRGKSSDDERAADTKSDELKSPTSKSTETKPAESKSDSAASTPTVEAKPEKKD
jgi:putative FmdB family regulatory protein